MTKNLKLQNAKMNLYFFNKLQIQLKMFLLFAYARYYPEGAYRDFVCKYNTFKECFEHALKSTYEFTEIYNVLEDPEDSDDRWFRNLDDDDDFDEEKGFNCSYNY